MEPQKLPPSERNEIIRAFTSEGELLDLSRFDLSSVNSVSAVCELLGTEELNINRNSYNFNLCKLNVEGITLICRRLAKMGNVMSVSFSWNQFGVEEIKPVGEMLRRSTRMRNIHLDGNRLSLHNNAGLKALIADISTKFHLETLNLQDNKIDGDGAAIIASNLLQKGILHHLNLRNNEIGIEGARHIAESLTDAKAVLKTLDLSYNRIGAVGARYLTYIIDKNKSIVNLLLEGNQLEDEGIRRICWTLKENNSLKVLHIGSNNCTAVGASYIADALSANNVLSELYLNRSHASQEAIRDDGAIQLARMIAINRGLTKLE